MCLPKPWVLQIPQLPNWVWDLNERTYNYNYKQKYQNYIKMIFSHEYVPNRWGYNQLFLTGIKFKKNYTKKISILILVLQ